MGFHPPKLEMHTVLFLLMLTVAVCSKCFQLLFPNFYHLKFQQLLSPFKKAWNSSIEKYGAFWNCEPNLFDLAKRIPHGIDDPNLAFAFDVKELRERLIIVCRLLCLFRSVDLSRLSRNISILDDKVSFIMIQRKGWKGKMGETHIYSWVSSNKSLAFDTSLCV